MSSVERTCIATSATTEYGLPEGWTLSSLGECVDILDSRRVPVNSDERAKRLGRTPYYGATGQVGWIDDCLFNEELLLLGEDGAPFLDKSLPISYIISGKSWVNNHAHVLRAVEGLTTNHYLKFWLDAFDFSEYVTGSTRLKLTQTAMTRMPVSLPPVHEQYRIVKKVQDLLGHVSGASDHLSRVPVILKRFRQAVLAAACSGKFTESWRSLAVSPTTSSASGSSKYAQMEPLFDLPSSWRWVSLESVCDDITVGHVGPMAQEYQEAGIPFLRSQNVREFRFDPRGLKYVSRKFHQKLNKSALRPGDVAVVRSGYAGVACVIPDTIPEANCADLVIIRPSTTLDPHYACIFINSDAGRAHVNDVKVGIAQSHFNVGAARNTPLPLPTLGEQQEIVRRVGALFALADNIAKRTANATLVANKLTQSIIAKAFRGELVPTEDELARREGREYEPASVLLERIRKERESLASIKPERKGKRKQDVSVQQNA